MLFASKYQGSIDFDSRIKETRSSLGGWSLFPFQLFPPQRLPPTEQGNWHNMGVSCSPPPYWNVQGPELLQHRRLCMHGPEVPACCTSCPFGLPQFPSRSLQVVDLGISFENGRGFGFPGGWLVVFWICFFCFFLFLIFCILCVHTYCCIKRACLICSAICKFWVDSML